MDSNWGLREWLMIGVFVMSCATLIYTIVSTYAIRGNDLKHITEMLQDLKDRVERLENIFIKGDK